MPGYASSNSRARGRFARNFVVQGSAADWALLLLAALRRTCADLTAELVFFQHDEVMVHCPAEEADAVVAAIREAAELAGRLTFGETPVRFRSRRRWWSATRTPSDPDGGPRLSPG